MEQVMMEQLTIDEWTRQLCAIPKQDFTIPRVLKFTQEKAIRPETLAPYLFYAKSHYTRNLIYKCEFFEVLAICWNVGQVSRIHNHRDQNCWMVTPIGRLRVQNFRVENRDTPPMAPANSFPPIPTTWTPPIPPLFRRKNLCIRC